MTKIGEVYKCEICGNIVELVHEGANSLVCCGQPMKLLEEKTQDIGKEKHVPIVEKTAQGIRVKVGSVEHPMLPEHHIQFIELIADEKSYVKFLELGQKPEAEFCVKAERVIAREYCNLHGLWKSN